MQRWWFRVSEVGYIGMESCTFDVRYLDCNWENKYGKRGLFYIDWWIRKDGCDSYDSVLLCFCPKQSICCQWDTKFRGGEFMFENSSNHSMNFPFLINQSLPFSVVVRASTRLNLVVEWPSLPCSLPRRRPPLHWEWPERPMDNWRRRWVVMIGGILLKKKTLHYSGWTGRCLSFHRKSAISFPFFFRSRPFWLFFRLKRFGLGTFFLIFSF